MMIPGGSPDPKRSVEGQKKRQKPQGVVTPGSASPTDQNTSVLYILIASGGHRRPDNKRGVLISQDASFVYAKGYSFF